MSETVLTSERVDEITKACLHPGSELVGAAVDVEGVLHRFQFRSDKLEQHKPAIAAMLAELPDQFHERAGGGWSFLNLCLDRAGNQWTGLHAQQEKLCALAIGAGLGSWLMPRDMWPVLPGGMPYFVVKADAQAYAEEFATRQAHAIEQEARQ